MTTVTTNMMSQTVMNGNTCTGVCFILASYPGPRGAEKSRPGTKLVSYFMIFIYIK